MQGRPKLDGRQQMTFERKPTPISHRTSPPEAACPTVNPRIVATVAPHGHQLPLTGDLFVSIWARRLKMIHARARIWEIHSLLTLASHLRISVTPRR